MGEDTSGKMRGGRIAAIVILSALAALLLGAGINNLASPCEGIFARLTTDCVAHHRYATWYLIFAGVAAFGAIIVYWSRPRGGR
jgi:hypothetical protein